MKKAAIVGPRQATLVDVPDPKAHGEWVVVKVHAAPMCAEYKAFVSGDPQSVMGHEAAGEIVEVADPGPVKVGDRVVVMPLASCGECSLCRSGDYIHCPNAFEWSGYVRPVEGCDTMAQYLLKPARLLTRIPDSVSYEHAALACCALGPSFGAMASMNVSAFDTVLITGAGPVGLGAIVNARFRGARTIVMENVPWRVAKARELGAEAVIDPADEDAAGKLLALTGGTGPDCSLDCSGNVRAERFCIDVTRRKGKVAFIGECNDELVLKVSPDLIRKGLTIMGSWHYNMNDYPKVLQVIERSPLVGQLISHIIPMSRIQEAFETSASHETAKIVLKPWE